MSRSPPLPASVGPGSGSSVCSRKKPVVGPASSSSLPAPPSSASSSASSHAKRCGRQGRASASPPGAAVTRCVVAVRHRRGRHVRHRPAARSSPSSAERKSEPAPPSACRSGEAEQAVVPMPPSSSSIPRPASRESLPGPPRRVSRPGGAVTPCPMQTSSPAASPCLSARPTASSSPSPPPDRRRTRGPPCGRRRRPRRSAHASASRGRGHDDPGRRAAVEPGTTAARRRARPRQVATCGSVASVLQLPDLGVREGHAACRHRGVGEGVRVRRRTRSMLTSFASSAAPCEDPRTSESRQAQRRTTTWAASARRPPSAPAGRSAAARGQPERSSNGGSRDTSTAPVA